MKLIYNNSLKNFLIIFILSIIFGYFFSTVYDFGQRAVDAALVISKIVFYPDEISPMKEYFLSSWTLLHQIAKFFLFFNWSFSAVSKFLIFIVAVIYFVGITLAVKSATKSIYLSVFVSLMILLFQKNFGDTDYPSLFFSEHSYGMFGLAISTFIFGCLFLGNLFLTGLTTAILISIHPIIGIWMFLIIVLSLLVNKLFSKFDLDHEKIVKGFIIGMLITISSLIYHFALVEKFSSSLDIAAYNNYMEFWEGHRNEAGYHFEYFLKTLILFTFGVLCLKTFKNKFDKNFKFGMICLLSSIFLSTIIYFIYKSFHPYMPDLIQRIMPTRFATLHSIIGWPILLGILFVLTKLFCEKKLISEKFSYILIIFIIFYYSVSHHKVFVKLNNLFIKNTANQIISSGKTDFWNDIKKIESDGYILTTFSTSVVSMRKTLKPILLDVSSFDFVPYYPNTAKSLSEVIENVYGIPFDNPPANISNRPFLLDEDIKLIFENYSEKKWKELSKDFNFYGVVVPLEWNLNLKPIAKNKYFTFYII